MAKPRICKVGVEFVEKQANAWRSIGFHARRLFELGVV